MSAPTTLYQNAWIAQLDPQISARSNISSIIPWHGPSPWIPSSSSYELQHALHMRSSMHCFVWRGVRGYLNILVVVIVKF